MRVASLVLLVAFAGCSSRTALDAGNGADALSLDAASIDAAAIDASTTDARTTDAPPNDARAVDAPIEPPPDGGTDASRDAGTDAARDAGTDAPVDGGIDAGASDAGADAPSAPDAGGPVYVLGEPLADCNTTCAAIGRTCGGQGSVGLDCLAHMELPSCLDPTMWIHRGHPSEPMRCLGAWGTSDVCSNNYNVYNSFCCRCD